MFLKNNEKEVEPGAGDFDKIATALETASEVMNRIAKFVIPNNVSDEWSDISSMSIHSLNDTVVDNACIHDLNTASTLRKSSNPEKCATSDESDSDTESYGKDTPSNNLETLKETCSFFSLVLLTIKFVFLLLLNIISIFMIVQLLFTTTVYILTGKMFLEFKAEQVPETWLEKVNVAVFGSEEEILVIRNVFEVFYKDNIVIFLKCLTKYFEHN